MTNSEVHLYNKHSSKPICQTKEKLDRGATTLMGGSIASPLIICDGCKPFYPAYKERSIATLKKGGLLGRLVSKYGEESDG